MDFAVNLVAISFRVSADDIWNGERSAPVTRARQVAMYVAAVGFGMAQGRIAAVFDRDRSSVSHALTRVEDQRDDPVFDTVLLQLEQAVRHAPAARFP